MQARRNDLYLNRWLNELLDEAYSKEATSLLRQIQKQTRSANNKVQQAIVELQSRIDELTSSGEELQPDDPAVVTVTEAFGTLMLGVGMRASPILERLEANGKELGQVLVGAYALAANDVKVNKSDLNLERIISLSEANNIDFQPPDPSSLSEIALADTWITYRERWADGFRTYLLTQANAQNTSARSVDIVSWLSNLVLKLPLLSIDNTMKTLHATAYRQSNLVTEESNTTLIAYKVRVAQLDSRTCLACIAQHGDILSIGTQISDHYRGRCSAYYVIAGHETEPKTMRIEVMPGITEDVPFMTGEQYLSSMTVEELQRGPFKGSPGKMKAYLSGVPLKRFIRHSHDTIYGDMTFEDSLVGMLGTQAYQFYKRRK